jgi:hypothetical protein
MTTKSRTGRPKKSVTMREANETEIQINQNTIDILLIKKDIHEIKSNHLAHLSADIKKIDKKVEKIDHRLWGIGMLIVASAFANYLI